MPELRVAVAVLALSALWPGLAAPDHGAPATPVGTSREWLWPLALGGTLLVALVLGLWAALGPARDEPTDPPRP